MISYEILEGDEVIVVTSTGLVTVKDYEAVAPKFFADVKSQAIRKALLDARKYQGLASKRAESLSFYSRMASRSVFDKIAVVMNEAIREEMLEFSDLVRNAGKEIRLFPQNQYEAALDWLKSDLATDKQE